MSAAAQVVTPMSASAEYPGVEQLPRTDHLLALHAVVRDAAAPRVDFIAAAHRIMRLVLEGALGQLRHVPYDVVTPTGLVFAGTRRAQREVIAVSVPRAGDAFEAELRQLVPDARIGKVVIQRDPTTLVPGLRYAKLPDGIAGREVLLMDPAMATAGTALMAIELIVAAGVRETDIVVANFLTCPEALAALRRARPSVRVVTGFVDEGLTEQGFMRPGMGDFGDRYYGTYA